VAEPKPTKPEDNSPRTGVEVLKPEERGGKLYFTVRDLRNGNIVKNITKASARRLWHYAITEYEELTSNPDQTFLQWHGDYGLIKKHKQGKTFYYDLIQRIPEGYRYYYGVTIDGIHGPWKYFTGEEE
jgi:hypothetical protein